ncbi:flagellar brake protein [Virgibacillus pantothenticus]|uniref:flagellar brake protein n=1 Tax=Virgibacillus pantothenticus TaxID=1473 RepID=UPI000987BEDF|nr:flagellar brake domain-containing protein [Virgibacillus pantothenticus]
MKIGTVLQLEVVQSGKNRNREAKKYRCKVIDKNEQNLYIDLPVDTKSKKTAFFAKGTIFDVTFIDSDEIIYQFRSKLVAKVKGKIPALAIQLPGNNIRRIQRRNYARVETAVDVAVHSDQNLFSPFTTVTNDISGGGLSIIVPKNQILKGELAEIWMVLAMANGQFVYPNVRAKLVHEKRGNSGIYIVSFQFLALDVKTEQWIIRFCFEKQREARKKQIFHR